MVMSEHTAVSHDLYQNDQFCELVGSSGPSQVTKFGSLLCLSRNGSNGAAGSFNGKSWFPKRVCVGECAAEGELAAIVVDDDDGE
jgi:hypothetical protein